MCIVILGVFGKMLAYTYVVEYQKRGLPHSHILLIVAESDRLKTPEDVDSVISAEFPPDPCSVTCDRKKSQATRLRNTVLRCMIHCPCGMRNPHSLCMVDGKCSKSFPKPFTSRTSWNERASYPVYRRREPHVYQTSAVIGEHAIDNSWVVPYNPFLSRKYDAQINVEACILHFASYFFLYINKVSLSRWTLRFLLFCKKIVSGK